MIGMVYWLTYLRSQRAAEAVIAKPWLTAVIPPLRRVTVINSVKTVVRPTVVPLPEPLRIQIEELVRAKEPALLDPGGKALLDVLARTKDDSAFMAKLGEKPGEAIRDYNLAPEEAAALISGDIRWIESKLGPVGDPLRRWLVARMTQEKW